MRPSRRLDTGGTQDADSPAGPAPRVDLGEHDARHPGVHQRVDAGTGPAGVGAGLEGDDGGAPDRAASARGGVRQGGDLGVRRAGPAVVARPEESPGGVEQHGADAGIGVDERTAAGEVDGEIHRRSDRQRCAVVRRVGGHLTSGSSRVEHDSGVCGDAAEDDPDPSRSSAARDVGGRRRQGLEPLLGHEGSPDCLPRAASHPDFHRRSWSSTRSTGHLHRQERSGGRGSRTITAGSELHRPRSTWRPVCHAPLDREPHPATAPHRGGGRPTPGPPGNGEHGRSNGGQPTAN